MIKKLIKFFVVLFLIAVVLLVATFFVLKQIYPPQRLKAIAQNYVSQKLQRELTFDSISFTWIGFTLNNVALSEEHTFQEGTFIKIDKLTAHVAPKPLLQKRIEINTIQADGLQVNIVTKKDGSFNFDTLLAASQTTTDQSPQQEDSASTHLPFVITAQKIRLTDCDLVYQNEQTALRTALNDLTIEINDFDLDAPFETKIAFATHISGDGQPTLHVPLVIEFKTFLAGLDLPNAYATISKATLNYKKAQLNLQGTVKNFEAPSIDLTGSLTGIDNLVFKEILPDLPNFKLPTIGLSLQAQANLENQTATVSQAKLSVKDSALLTQGTVNWNGPTVAYNFSGSLKAVINQLVQMTDTLDDFRPEGTLTASFKATEKKDFTDLRANILLNKVGIRYEPVTLTELSGNIALASLEDISSTALTGKLNGENFTGSFAYKQLPTATNLTLNLNLDKLVLTQFTSSTQASAKDQPQTAGSSSSQAAASTPMNIQANIQIGGVSVPYLQSSGFTLAANLKNVNDTMAHANGTVNFALQPGKITNLDDFIKDSKTAKILLLPLSIIKKVAGVLKINLFPSTNKEQGTTISFTQGAGDYTFVDGVMNIDKTVFNSSATNISASGSANFQTDALDMKAKATLLTQAAPIAFKITGTMSEPKGKLDVVNTVTSVVGNLLNGTTAKSAANGTISLTKTTASTATNTVKGTVSTATDVVKGIGGLFKKKGNDNK